MRSTHKTRACTYCTQPTRFELDIRGSRGGVTTVPCCPDCGENPDKRKEAA